MIARLLDVEPTQKGVIVRFNTISNAPYEKLMKYISNGNLLKIDVSTVSQRSLDQNALYWKIISDCVKHPNSSFTDRTQLHIYLLKKVNAKSEIVWVDDTNAIKGKYRAFNIVDVVYVRDKQGHSKKLYICECFLSSTTFNRKEMSELIEQAILYADIIGVRKAYGEEWRLING